MSRILIILLTLMLPFSALGEELAFAPDLIGVYTWPEGVPEQEASYIYRYAYPQLGGESDIALTINNVFQYEASDALGFECPMIGSSHNASEGVMQVDITSEIVHQSPAALSVRIDKTITVGKKVSRIVKAYTFALTDAKKGAVTSLPYLLGIIEDGSTDEWLVDRQTAKADECAREMVWALIEADMKKPGSVLYEDLTFEEFEGGFYPEEDFYLDAEGNFVFFLQEGVIAPAEAGQFFYTIPLDDLLDEI